MMKSDGDLVGLNSYDEAARVAVSGFFASSTTPTFNMVPCKQKTSPPTSPIISFKESDSNGNDIRNDKNLGGMQPEKTDVSSYFLNIFLSDQQI